MKIKVKRLIKAALVILAGIAFISAVEYCCYDDTSFATRITMHDFYQQDSVDDVLIGPSHIMYGLNAAEISDLTGRNVYNLGSSGQRMDTSYMLLKEAENRYHPEKVWLEVSPYVLTVDSDESDSKNTYIVADYTKWGLPKLELYLSRLDDNLSLICKAARLSDSLSELNIADLMEAKSSDYYRTFTQSYPYQNVRYLGKGSWTYCIDEENTEQTAVNVVNSVEDGAISDMEKMDVSTINSSQVGYLRKIISYCKKNDIELILFMMPLTEFYINYAGGYEEVSDYVESIADANGVSFYNLNKAIPGELSLPLNLWYNVDHLLLEGQEILSKYMAEFMADPSSKHFAATVDEARAEELKRITGISLTWYEDGTYVKPWSESEMTDVDMLLDGRYTFGQENGQYFIGRDLRVQLKERNEPITVEFLRNGESLGTFEVTL